MTVLQKSDFINFKTKIKPKKSKGIINPRIWHYVIHHWVLQMEIGQYEGDSILLAIMNQWNETNFYTRNKNYVRKQR